jgi:hypothetical protein
MTELIRVELSADERELLVMGLREWGGPTRATDELARAIGFPDVNALYSDAKRIAARLDDGAELTSADWARALIATELAFASDYYGPGREWAIATGYDDETTIRRLRQVQRKLVGIAKLG